MTLYLQADQISAAVRKLYAKNGYVVLSQVRNGTGYARPDRTADMLVVSTWPSRGLHAEGIEIKSSRSDLMRELSKPEKADEIARYCQHWWLAVPEGLITADMIVPETWGVITVNEKLNAKHSRPVGAAVKLIAELRGRPVDQIAAAKQALSAGISAIDAALRVMDAPLSRTA